MSKPLRIAFMGTPDFVVPTVQALIDSLHDLVCLYTQPPREKGRHHKLEKTPVHLLAEEQNIEICHPENFKSAEDVQKFKDLNLDVAIVAAYGMLLPESILNAPKFGCINIHPSLLPRWRGPSPIQYAIWHGDQETGVSIMRLDKGMDSGPILAQEKTPVDDKNFEILNKELWQTGTKLLLNVLDDLSETGELKLTPQNHEDATYCKLFTKEQGRIHWTQTAEEIDRQVRGLNPWPGTWCLDQEDKRIKILAADAVDNPTGQKPGTVMKDGFIICGQGAILPTKIQPENKKPMDIKSALNGGYLKEGDVLQ